MSKHQMQTAKQLSTLPYHFATLTCQHVSDGSRLIKLVLIDEGNDLCVLCGETDHMPPHRYRWVGIGHLIEADQTLHNVPSLLRGEEAYRESTAGTWAKRALLGYD